VIGQSTWSQNMNPCIPARLVLPFPSKDTDLMSSFVTGLEYPQHVTRQPAKGKVFVQTKGEFHSTMIPLSVAAGESAAAGSGAP